MAKDCKIEGCTSNVRARGWCNLHYRRWLRTGDPLKAAWERGNREANFWSKVQRRGAEQCWMWKGFVGPEGYGRFGDSGSTLAHRVAYELTIGPIPDGLQLDHTCHTHHDSCPGGRSCRHRRCVNPAHLEPVTLAENASRISTTIRARRSAQSKRAITHCPRGHAYDEANTYVDKRGCRNCRTCARERSAAAAKTPGRKAYMHRHYLTRRAAQKE